MRWPWLNPFALPGQILAALKRLDQHMTVLSDLITNVSTDVTAIAGQVSQVLAVLTAGQEPTQAEIDALTAADAGLKKIGSDLAAALPSVPTP